MLLVFHYTGSAGLLGMLKSKAVWATDARFLNDFNELVLARPMVEASVRRRIQELRSHGPSALPDGSLESFDQLEGRCDSLGRLVLAFERANDSTGQVFVTSFSTARDTLIQWQSYGFGGYAVGFDSDELTTHRPALQSPEEKWPKRLDLSGTSVTSELVPVIYDPITAQAAVDKIIGGLFLMPFDFSPSWEFDEAIRSIVGVAARIKGPDWASEQKQRLIVRVPPGSIGSAPIDFRVAGGLLVPYLSMPFDRSSAIQEIIVGPGDRRSDRYAGVEAIVSTFDFRKTVQLFNSNVSLR